MRKTLLAAALLASMTACQNSETPTAAPAADTAATAADTAKADAAFADLSKRALEGWLQLSPVSATQIGEHKYDGELDDLSAAGRQKGLAFSKKILAELDATDTAALSRENQVDAAILRNQLQYDIWTAETLQSWAWDPQVYNNVAGGAIAMGHPLGATGAMILGTVLDELERRDRNTALVTLCIGAGMGTATIFERV